MPSLSNQITRDKDSLTLKMFRFKKINFLDEISKEVLIYVLSTPEWYWLIYR